MTGDLYHRIRKQGATNLPEAQIRRWTAEILSALRVVHDRKMIHRDLKPQNVFLMADDTVKIGDFGIVRDLSTSRAAHTQIGTPFYISPEICHNKPYDHKSDLWSFGCLIYEMCTLKPPFMADDLKAMMKRICYSEPAPIPGLYSKELKQLVAGLLQKDPRQRPSAKQMAESSFMAEIVETMIPVESHPVPPLSEASRFDPDAASVAETSSSGGSGAAGAAGYQRRRGQRGLEASSASRGRREESLLSPERAASRIQGAFRESLRRKGKQGSRRGSGGENQGKAPKQKGFRPNPLQGLGRRRESAPEPGRYNHIGVNRPPPAPGHPNNPARGYQLPAEEILRQLPGGEEYVAEFQPKFQPKSHQAMPEPHLPRKLYEEGYPGPQKPQQRYQEAVQRRRFSLQEHGHRGCDAAGFVGHGGGGGVKAKSHSPTPSARGERATSPSHAYSDPGNQHPDDVNDLKLPCIKKSSPPQFGGYGEAGQRRGVAVPRERIAGGIGPDGKPSYVPVPPWGGDERFDEMKPVRVRRGQKGHAHALR